MTKTTFAGVPGLVLLASGGLCEQFDTQPGETILEEIVGEGSLLDKGPNHAMQHISTVAQQRWHSRSGTYCEDISGIMIQWLGPGRAPASLTPVGQAAYQNRIVPGPTSLTQDSHPSSAPRLIGARSPVQALNASPAASSFIIGSSPNVIKATSTSVLSASVSSSPNIIQASSTSMLAASVSTSPNVIQASSTSVLSASAAGKTLASDRIIQADHSLPPRSVPSTLSDSIAEAAETRKFLQAQPFGASFQASQSLAKAKVPLQVPPPPRTSPAHQTFLQAAPASRLTSVPESAEASQ